MTPTFIEYYDYLLLIPYILVFFLIARRIAKKHAETSRELYWLLISWWIKIIACILYAWMIVYYYRYGDPLGYKDRSDALMFAILKDPENIKYLFLSAESFAGYLFSLGYSNLPYYSDLGYYNDPVFTVSKVGCIAAFLSFNRFLIISFVFTNIAYYGFILIYTTSKKIVQGYNKQLAIACLFIPSCVYWSSGFAKEPLCIIALGFIFSSMIKLFSQKEIRITTIFTLIFFSYLLLTVKDYIFYSFLVAFIFWKLYNAIASIMSKGLLIKIWTVLFFLMIAGGSIAVSGVIMDIISNNLGSIITSNIDMYELMASSNRGSLIEVKDIDVTSLQGILRFIPQALVNVFFRPFPWEIANVLMVFTVLENLFFIYLLFKVFLQSRLFTKHLFINKNYQVFTLLFTITMAFVVGISTFNMGSMVRYKMPYLPFFASFLLIINKKLADGKRAVRLQNETLY